MSFDYTNKISKAVQQVPPSAIRKFFDLANEMKGHVISLSIGEPDFVTPWSIREAGINSLIDGYTHYSPNSGYIDSRTAIADYLKRRYGVAYDPAHEILITVGGSEGLDLVARALINPGDEVVVVEPCFVAYKATVEFAHGVPVVVSTKPENDYRLMPEELEAAITDKTKYIIVGYPNNPTGAVMTLEDWAKIKDVLLRHPDIIVLSDELYCELNYLDGKPASLTQFSEIRDRVIMVNGFSKSYAMTGFRVGYIAGPAELVAPMIKIHQYCIMCAPTTSQYAAVEALHNGDDDVKMMRESYDERRRFVLHMLAQMGLPCFEPEGAFYVFPCIREFGMTSDEFATRLLKEEKVAIVPGTAFGDCGEGYLRISYAYSIDNLKKALGRLEKFVGSLRA